MHLRNTLLLLLTGLSMALSAQTQSWQWIKAGGSNTDNTGINNMAAGCKIGGCDAIGNVYALGDINGPNVVFDTFQSPGTYSSVDKNHIIFSYDCSGNMRWAKQVGDLYGYPSFTDPGFVTDVQGNSYLSCVYLRGFMIGDTSIDANIPQNFFIYLIKLDSLGGIVWIQNYGNVTSGNYVGGQCHGIRIGSSGNLWLNCYFDTNYVVSPAFHSTNAGNYQVEVDPSNGNVLEGYYISNSIPSDYSNFDTRYDIDGNENYYEVGTLAAAVSGIGPGDTLYLNGHTFAPDSSQGPSKPYIYSLDKNGNFRFYKTNTGSGTPNPFTCKYDLPNDQLISTFNVDQGMILGTDTPNFNLSQIYNATGYSYSKGIYSMGPGGNSLWFHYLTYAVGDIAYGFANTPTAAYISSTQSPCFEIYNGLDTFMVGDTANLFSPKYYRTLHKIDANGNIVASYTAYLGAANPGNGDAVTSGATDWRGNLYMGGSITNFMALPNGDSVSNTDPTSGNFFIAKIGISDCSCPSPGVQFTQTSNGDTAYFDGSTLNHSDSIHWEFGDGTTASGDTFKHVYAQNGSYTVTAIAYSGCGVDSITKQVTVRNVGISVVEPDKTNLYPNPATNAVNLEASGAATIGLVFANGCSAWDHPVQVSQSGTYVFDMAKYSSGLYYFIVQYTNGKVDVMQVVKE